MNCLLYCLDAYKEDNSILLYYNSDHVVGFSATNDFIDYKGIYAEALRVALATGRGMLKLQPLENFGYNHLVDSFNMYELRDTQISKHYTKLLKTYFYRSYKDREPFTPPTFKPARPVTLVIADSIFIVYNGYKVLFKSLERPLLRFEYGNNSYFIDNIVNLLSIR